MNNSPARHDPWYRQAAKLMPRHFYLKSLGTMLFISLFFGVYFYLLKYPAYPTTLMPVTWLDHLIGFQPLALPVYLSLWVYVSLPPLFLASKRELYAYGLAMTLTCLIGLGIFYLWPTAAPAADIDWALYPGMDFLKNMDASGNAFPSLHVATAVFSGIWLHHLLHRLSGPLWLLTFNGAWCVGIVYSTLAIRQHVAVDMWAGLVLGGVAAYLSLRQHRRTKMSMTVPNAPSI
ncbi:PAP2 superfamily protein [Polaromonas sp. OV174]|uniref:phosphatase PAP2 family protein n=1 Tax=Polaromonas sp. OV174 TaxID=1855300 RepID=UPI0008F288D0|nr:phosphatase PAP2 family protein [Polaromonas sp. OV174]SFB73113.1 PAP2 superfamily protein [Polaromonas sp. OV174]